MRPLPVISESRGPRGVEVTSPRTVRLSLTDRCDLACVYCRPHRSDGYFEERLSLGAWRTLLAALRESGVVRARITGGEPLLSADVVPFVALLAELGFEDIALTTNATRLEKLAEPLRAAGLHRLNVSLDTLDAQRFERLTRGGKLAGVLRGIERAREVGFTGTKLNTVVVRGENDGELACLAQWSWERDITPRFLEIMAIGEGATMQDGIVSFAEMRLALAPLLAGNEDALREPDRGPARYLRARHDPSKRVGFITGTTDTYCAGCDRLRVAADGTLRPCLATNDGVAASESANGGSIEGVREALAEAWRMKPDGETWKGCTEGTARHVSIRQIGG